MRTVRFPRRPRPLTDGEITSTLYPDTSLQVAPTDELRKAQDFVWTLALIDSIFGENTDGLYLK